MYDVDAFLRRASEELADYSSHEQRFEELLNENARRLGELRGRLSEAWAQLGRLALPEPGEAQLSGLADRLRLPGLKTIAQEMATRRAQIEALLERIEQNPLYQEREVRRVRLQAQLDEEEPLFEYAQRELQRLDALEGMRELISDRWGTPEYEHRGWLRFFDPEFLKDWRNADQIVEALKVSDFREAAARFQERLEQATEMRNSVERLRRELSEIDELERQREALLAEREALPATMQWRAGQMLGQTLQTRGKESLQAFPAPEETLRVFAEVDGIEHQVRYLEEMSGRMRADLGQLLERSGRLREEVRRYESNRHKYRNKRFTPESFGKRFGKTSRYGKLHHRYSRASDTVYHFHEYDRGANWSDFLWWDVMTDGRMDGNFIGEVSEWRDRHPGYAYAAADVGGGSGSGSLSEGWVTDRDDS